MWHITDIVRCLLVPIGLIAWVIPAANAQEFEVGLDTEVFLGASETLAPVTQRNAAPQVGVMLGYGAMRQFDVTLGWRANLWRAPVGDQTPLSLNIDAHRWVAGARWRLPLFRDTLAAVVAGEVGAQLTVLDASLGRLQGQAQRWAFIGAARAGLEARWQLGLDFALMFRLMAGYTLADDAEFDAVPLQRAEGPAISTRTTALGGLNLSGVTVGTSIAARF